MASFDPRVENLDEFDEAQEMSTTFCQQLTEEEYEEKISEETEKAIQGLCDYLQENPDAYYRILRKRKQEELENAGIFSFLKVKMMSVLHGEQYPACLVSPEQSARHLSQLKGDMQKAFAYSEESKGRRFSKRIAAQSRHNDLDKENTPVLSSQRSVRRVRLDSGKQSSTPPADVFSDTRVLRSDTGKTTKTPAGPSKLQVPPIMAVLPNKTVENQAPVSVPLPPPPPPPPPPPVPPLLPQHRNASQQSCRLSHSGSKKRKFDRLSQGGDDAQLRSPLSRPALHGRSVSKRKTSDSGKSSSSTSSGAEESRDGKQSGGDGSGDTADVTPCTSLPSSPEAEFVTPDSDVPVLKKSHKRTLSNTSTGSVSSQGSFLSIHSELMASNPITRLRSTQLSRSPGGTPLRSLNGPRAPQEPLHKALVTVLRQKFKNVRSPSPLTITAASVNSPALSQNNSLNATFSP